MKKENKNTERKVNHLPEHGPLNSEGKEILLSLKNVDITFGKGDRAVKAVKMLRLTFSKARRFRSSVSPAPENDNRPCGHQG